MSQSIKVLIVDDHPVFRAGVVGCLREDPGIEVIGEAGTGQDALREATRLGPDLVLMDISLAGGMDGIATTRRLCGALPNIRVLILSMHDKPHYVAQSVAAGAGGYVLKSSDGAELLRGIRAVHYGGTYFGKGVTRDTGDPSPKDLTKCELAVLCLVAQGLSSARIAQLRGCSIGTVNTQRQSAYDKPGVHNAAEATRYVIEHGLCAELPHAR